jgi:hypothetical protein
MKIEATISRKQVLHALQRKHPRAREKDLESELIHEIKQRFIGKGIVFMDKPGLYPIPPCHKRLERVGNDLVYTIRQDLA